MNKYLAEFIGTFFLVLTIGSGSVPARVSSPRWPSAALMVMVLPAAASLGAL
jgi:glycerol uptake facilitator-like aquaporin